MIVKEWAIFKVLKCIDSYQLDIVLIMLLFNI